MPPEKKIVALSSFKERHPRLYTLLYQFLLAIVTFYCALAIARYGPERDPASVAPRALASRTPLSDANSTTPHICTYGAREDIVDPGYYLIVRHLSFCFLPNRSHLLSATVCRRTLLIIPKVITPYVVLCPSTPVLLLSLITFVTGIWKFNALHTEDIYLADGYSMILSMTIFSIDWHHILVSLQIYLPIFIWIATVMMPVMHWFTKTCFPGVYRRYREAKTAQAEEAKTQRESRREGGRELDVEQGQQGEVQVREEAGEETPLKEGEMLG